MTEFLRVFTVPSIWVRDRAKPFPEDYDRVVGMANAAGERLWSPKTMPHDPNGVYAQSDAAEKKLPTNPKLRSRLMGFFVTYLAQADEAGAARTAEYNCHSFARAIIGEFSESAYSASGQCAEASQVVVDGSVVMRGLDLGERGVIGWWHEGFPRGTHSMIGLGGGDCIQVMAANGYLGVSSCSSVRNYYDAIVLDEDPSGKHADYGLYVAKASSATVG